jgi:hypothetical protein
LSIFAQNPFIFTLIFRPKTYKSYIVTLFTTTNHPIFQKNRQNPLISTYFPTFLLFFSPSFSFAFSGYVTIGIYDLGGLSKIMKYFSNPSVMGRLSEYPSNTSFGLIQTCLTAVKIQLVVLIPLVCGTQV